MCNTIDTTAQITGIAGNTSTAKIEVSKSFYPIVRVALSSENPENITQNLIFKVFQDSDEFIERYKPFTETKMESVCLMENENYLIPYLRMWPPQEGERIFKLACIISDGKDNCSDTGDIYVEMPTTVTGLKINNAPEGVIKDIYTNSTIPLELSLSTNADRTLTDINAVPLVFYVLNDGERTNVGMVHLSVAPRDVFSKAEVKDALDYLEGKPYYTHTIKINGKEVKHDCLTAVRVTAEKLLNVNLKGAIVGQFRIGEFENYLRKKGYLASSVTINIGNSAGKIILPVKDQKNSLYFHVKKEIENNLGFHFYSISISEIHTETLYISYLDPQYPLFSIHDQFNYAGRGYRCRSNALEYNTEGKRDRTKNLPIEKLDDSINAEIADWQRWTYDMIKNTYPANGKFLRLQRSLIALMCILIFASCNFKSKEYKELINTDKEPISNDSVLKKNDSLPCLNLDSLRFSELIKLVELNDLTQCEPLIPLKNDLLLELLKNQNQEIIYHFVEGCMFCFDYGFTEKSMMGLEIYTFDSEQFADQFAKIAFIYETKQDPNSRVARYANSIYRIYHLTYIYEARIKYEKLVEDWDKIYWDKVY